MTNAAVFDRFVSPRLGEKGYRVAYLMLQAVGKRTRKHAQPDPQNKELANTYAVEDVFTTAIREALERGEKLDFAQLGER